MTFPESERVVFGLNPIAQVICQLRFPPVLEILTAPPAGFQNGVRQDYPLYEREETTGLPAQLQELIAKLPSPMGLGLADAVVHRFLTTDRDRSIGLTKDFLSLAANTYAHWQEFRARLTAAKDALEQNYRPSFYTRIGLRYVNVIDRKRLGLEGRGWNELLTPPFVGVIAERDVGDKVTQYQSTAVIDLGDRVTNGFVTLRLGLVPTAAGASQFVIDNDFFLEGKIEGPDVLQVLDEFNRLDGNLFRWAIGRDGPLWAALQPLPDRS